MKKLSILLLIFISFLGLNACSSEDDIVFTAQPDPEGISFSNTFAATYILTDATSANVAERFVWKMMDVDVPTNITYELQGSANADFSNYSILGATGKNNIAITVQQLMDLAKDAGLDNDPATEDMPNTGQVYFRIVSSVGTENGLQEISEIQALTIILPEDAEEGEITLRNFFLVGDATAAGWNPANNNTPLFRDAENSDLYFFSGRFAGGEAIEGFKLLETQGWQPQWGLSDGALSNSEILGGDPAAFPVATDAYFSFTMNVEEMTYSFEEIDASTAATYDAMGIIGAATPGGWDADTDLTQSEFNPHIWYLSNLELIDGEFKFRANDAWDANWGVALATLSGQASLGSQDNMTAAAGIYNVWFNDLTGRYILIPNPPQE